MYSYEGEDYSKAGTSDADKTAFDKLAQDLQNSVLQERGSRKDSAKKQFVSLADHPTRKRKVLTDEEKEALKLKREENKIKRAKLLAEQQQEKLLKLWKSHNYESAKLEIITSDDSSDSETESNYSYVTDDETSSQKIINYVVGDVTCPQNIATKDAIIVHCVDDSGLWGSGGLFSAIDKHSTHPKDQYELSAKMKDLKVGDVHLIKMKTTKIPDQAIYVALLVAHTRNRKNELSPLLFPELTQGLQKICYIAKKTGASVHFPRIGHNTPNFNWYGTEKLIKKTLVQKGVSTSVYYYKRRAQISSDRTCTSSKPPEDFDTILSTSSKDLDTTLSTSSKDLGTTLSTSSKELDTNMEVQCKRPDGNNSSKVQNNLHDIFTGCCVFFHGFHANDNALNQLQRYVIAYDGDVTTDYWSPEMTHVVVNSGARLDDDMSEHFAGRDLTCVKLSWVYECISKKFIVPVSEHSAF